ncbi:hypothetical protein ACFST9_05190 [Hymenobacter monticola]|uniref:Uncharacterized protein n=1 Tax=Hymenobacter monticola TaxID=1705399 RepID=A0ABY4BAB4_9BACT|nr:hypothetical protein [Hymenobacter monticola]UOE36015.1 hypothetical protein MTP16_10320 [Hymenobacter monticola]
MDAAELERRIGDFDNTANVCGIDMQGPEELLELLYEDFAVSVGSFFHPVNLDILLTAGVITHEIKERCLTVERKVDYLTQHPDLVETIKGNSRWEEVVELCKQICALKLLHTL